MKRFSVCFLLSLLLLSVGVFAQNKPNKLAGDSVRVHSVTTNKVYTVETNNKDAPIISCVFDVEFFNRSQQNKWFLIFRDKFEDKQISPIFKKSTERQIDWFGLHIQQNLLNLNEKVFVLYYTGDVIYLSADEATSDSFEAIKLPPDGNIRDPILGGGQCNEGKNLVVWEADDLIVNGNESLENWWDYPLLSSSGLTLHEDNMKYEVINIIAWLRKPPSPKSKIAERIYSLEATNVKKHMIPLKINFGEKLFNKIQTNVQSKTKLLKKKSR